MNRKRLGLCIPTYNRHDTVETFVEAEAEILKKYFVDLIIIDSSTDNETLEVVEKYNAQGYEQIYYTRVDESISSNEKFFWIYQTYCSCYDYLWISHDHTLFNEVSIEYIIEKLGTNADFFFLKSQCEEFKYYETNDLCKFLYDSAWLLGKMGAAIVNSSCFLEGVDWSFIRNKYLTPEKLNFSHVGFYFERAAQLSDFVAATIEIPTDYFLDVYRNKKLSWENEAIRICSQCWGSVIESLPSVYTNKLQVMRTIDPYFLTVYKLLDYRKAGNFSWKVFLKYRKWIRRVFPHLYADAFVISIFPMKILIEKYSKGYSERIASFRQNGKKICIYGAGKHAQESIDFFDGIGIEIDAVLVTSTKGNVSKLCGIMVYDAKEYIMKNDVFIIVAVAGDARTSITRYLEKLKSYNAKIVYSFF